MKLSAAGLLLIKSFEGFRPKAARHDNGGWVIGYGHTKSAREGLTVSQADADLLLQYDLIEVVKAVNESATEQLNPHQFDALVSFAWSIGLDRFRSSNVLERLNAGSSKDASEALSQWADPIPATRVRRRRAAERALFDANPQVPVTLAQLMTAPLPDEAVAPFPTAIPTAQSFKATVDEPRDSVGPVVSVEPRLRPSRGFDWSYTGAFLLIGALGMLACGASAALFRLTTQQAAPGQTPLIASVFALLGVVFVGVAAWKLYSRWGRSDAI